MLSIEIVIQPDGSLLIERGLPDQNTLTCDLLAGLANFEELRNFFAVTDKSELIFGETTLCG